MKRFLMTTMKTGQVIARARTSQDMTYWHKFRDKGIIDCQNCDAILFVSPTDVQNTDIQFFCYDCLCTERLKSEREKVQPKPETIQAIANNIPGLTQETIKALLQYRPFIEPILLDLKPILKPENQLHLELPDGVFISQKPEPYLNMGYWGKPAYNSCQDYRDLAWSDKHLKMQHHLEDPSVYIAWQGTANKMVARALLRHVRNKAGQRFVAIDAFYGDRNFGWGVIEAANHLRELLKIKTPLQQVTTGQTAASLEPSHFTSNLTSYADIGTWVKTPTGFRHISGIQTIKFK